MWSATLSALVGLMRVGHDMLRRLSLVFYKITFLLTPGTEFRLRYIDQAKKATPNSIFATPSRNMAGSIKVSSVHKLNNFQCHDEQGL